MGGSGEKKLLWDDKRFSQRSSTAEQLTGFYAKKLLEQAGIPEVSNHRPLVVLDNACGTGIVTQALHDMVKSKLVESIDITCGDLADAMVAAATQRIDTAGWSNTKALKVDAQDTKLPSDHFTHIFTNFGPMLFPNASAMLDECKRMLKHQGVCAFTTWKTVGWMNDTRDALNSIPDVPQFPAGEKFIVSFSKSPWWDEKWVMDEFTRHGFENVKVEVVPNTTVIEHGAELQTLLRTIMAIVQSSWTEEERKQLVDTNANGAVDKKIEEWFAQKYQGPVRWDWVALVVTGEKLT